MLISYITRVHLLVSLYIYQNWKNLILAIMPANCFAKDSSKWTDWKKLCLLSIK